MLGDVLLDGRVKKVNDKVRKEEETIKVDKVKSLISQVGSDDGDII